MRISEFVDACLGTYRISLSNTDSETFTEEALYNAINTALKEEYRLNVVKWEPSDASYPKYMLLGGDRGILAYIRYFYCETKDALPTEYFSLSSKNVLRTICSANSALDRPVFFVYLINEHNGAKAFFETDEQIKDRWLSTGFSGDTYSPVLDEAGTIENLISIMLDLKKNNVRV